MPQMRMLRSTIIAALSALLIALTGTNAEADNLIVAGQRIGPISLGMSAAELFRVMGDPTETQSNEFMQSYLFGRKHEYGFWTLNVRVENSRIFAVTTSGPEFSTPDGIHVGDSRLAMEAKMGPPERTHKLTDNQFVYDYKRRSISLQVINGRIVSINVGSPHR